MPLDELLDPKWKGYVDSVIVRKGKALEPECSLVTGRLMDELERYWKSGHRLIYEEVRRLDAKLEFGRKRAAIRECSRCR